MEYYDARSYVVKAKGRTPPPRADEYVASRLELDLIDLVEAGVGTFWIQVESPDLPRGRTWFTHGDPWCILLGLGPSDAVVSGLDLFEGGMIGPPCLTATRTLAAVPLDGQHTVELVAALDRARKAQHRAMRVCGNCRSPRYAGCRCDSFHRGIIYD
jgi:hypothetical protein